jgi:group I intron endonuclease
MIGIYKITSPSNRVYIGQTVNYHKRITSYKNINQNKSLNRLKASFLKYGTDNHIFELIEECDVNLLNERERYWQDYYCVLSDKGLNCKLTNTNDKSGRLSETIKIKIGAGNKGKVRSEDYKLRVSKFFTGRKLTKEHIDKISLGNKGKKLSEEHKAILSIARKKDLVGNVGKKGKDNMLSKKVLDTITNKTWYSLSDCCKENNLSIKNMSRQLNGSRKNNTHYIYI